MDVVKTNIGRLGGSIDIKTVLGQGTKFSIKLPLTLLIYAALLVKCGEQEFAISLTSVEETARIPIAHVHKVGTHEVIKLRDQVLPIRRLSRILKYNHHTESSDHQAYVPIVIVRSAEQILALMVDELIGRETIVVKPLGDYLKKVRLFSGATISGEGKVRLILDIPTIVEQEFVSKTPGKVAAMTIPLEPEAYEEFVTPVQPKEQMPELILIDDSISIRKMMGMFLSNAGYQVELANDGVEAIEKISTHPYDLIITDLEMPRMHGYELIAEVRSAPETKQIPIIVLTSRAGDKHYKKAMDLGANDYIVKPVDEGTLLESVRKLLSK
jgi:chemosensory pili system protein ChpA (sensor histidine kinase/response regulator)